jgi:hypothetical protein
VDELGLQLSSTQNKLISKVERDKYFEALRGAHVQQAEAYQKLQTECDKVITACR